MAGGATGLFDPALTPIGSIGADGKPVVSEQTKSDEEKRNLKHREGRATAISLYGSPEQKRSALDYIFKQREEMAKGGGMTLQDKLQADAALRAGSRALRGSQAQSGIKGATASAQQGQLARQYGLDIAGMAAQRKRGDISTLAQQASGEQAQLASLPLAYEQLEVARQTGANIQSQAAQPITVQDSGGITVICTELKRQSLLPIEVWRADKEHGEWLLKTSPETFVGYYSWAKYVAKAMSKSKLLTHIIRPFAVSWAYHIAGRRNLLGGVINAVGTPLCKVIGKIIIRKEYLCL